MTHTLHIHPSHTVTGDIRIPGDKSISHRAVILSAISEQKVIIKNLLFSEDILATIQIMQCLGVKITLDKEMKLACVTGVGLHGLQSTTQWLDCKNSGTTMRLLTGLLSAQPFNSVLIGDVSLMRRPMLRIANPLRQMGAIIHLTSNNTAPIKITGNSKLTGIYYELSVPSAQVKSGILLASLYARGKTAIIEQIPTRDHTERMMRYFNENDVTVIEIPGDLSSAAFFIVLAAITPHSNLIIRRVGVNPLRMGVIQLLKLMGADISLSNEDTVNNEPIADIYVKYTPLRGIQIPLEYVANAIDELPIILIAAVSANGNTLLRGASELRVKESDRIAAMVIGLRALGVQVEEHDDGMMVYGNQQFHGGRVSSMGDHRIAMAFAIAGHNASNTIIIDDCDCVNTSFPNFTTVAKQVGLVI